MRRRFLLILMAVLIIISAITIFPTTAFAADEPVPHFHDDITFDPWNETNTMPNTAGDYYLTSDITLSSTWNVPAGTTNLCLNGHIINANGGAFSAITIGSSSVFNLYDCGTEIYNGYIDAGGLWHMDKTNSHSLQSDETEMVVIGGIITGSKRTDNNYDIGGGVFNSGVFTMYGGNIAGCEVKTNGGGVFNKGTFTMRGGSIIGCKTLSTESSRGLGGGVFNFNGGLFTLSGGMILNNTASRHGGGIQNNGSGTTVISGGSILNNTAATKCGGGINSDGTLTISGGIIANNKANGDGGGLRYNGGSKMLLISNCSITGNTTLGKGGGVIASGAITLGGAVDISGNYNITSVPVEQNLYLLSYKITLGSGDNAPANGMYVGITTQDIPTDVTPVQITTNGTANDLKYLTSDISSFAVTYNTSGYLQVADHTHTGTKQDGQPQTEETAGFKDYYKCNCGIYFEDSTCKTVIGDETALAAWKAEGGNGYLPKLQHTHSLVKQDAVEPSTKSAGCKEYYICYCGKAYEDEACSQEIIDIAAWKAEGGNGYLPKLQHTHSLVKQDAIEPGTKSAGCKEYYICYCGKAYEDEACTQEIIDIAAWKAEGGNGYIAPLGEKTGSNFIWLWILLIILLILIIIYIVVFFIWRKKEELPKALKFLAFLVPSYKAINKVLFKKKEEQ